MAEPSRTSPKQESNLDRLRIACLDPSATAICEALNLRHLIVGVTHECDLLATTRTNAPQPMVLTRNGLGGANGVDPMSQADIHAAVQASATIDGSTCVVDSSCSSIKATTNPVPSLYPLLPDEFEAARPNLVFTQDLCSVCAPTQSDVEKVVQGSNRSDDLPLRIVSISPKTLDDVAASFVTVAAACGVPTRGYALKEQWEKDLERLKATVLSHRTTTPDAPRPRMLVLEWLDPPFKGGHWTDQMMEFACVQPAIMQPKGSKSTVVPWTEVEDTIQPDVILVGCCGFDLPRNVRDAQAQMDKWRRLQPPCGVFCCDGNRFIAQPSPKLLQGAVIMAKCAYHDQPQVLEAIDELRLFLDGEEDEAWCKLDITEVDHEYTDTADRVQPNPVIIPDVEDVAGIQGSTTEGFHRIHEAACKQGLTTYEDPSTGYSVFTEIAHRNRGWCCGSGCRHCPYSHVNVDNKATKIQQPAFLFKPEPTKSDTMFSIMHHDSVKVLFFSGGKDSFLTLRKLVREYHGDGNKSATFGLVLLTTFDATTRMIAHQDVPIDDVMRQAKHLNVSLLGVPLRRGSGEAYSERIKLGLQAIQKELDQSRCIGALVFGDLHLEHIREWRDRIMPTLGYSLEYPLWNVSYDDLMNDLEESEVPCFVSGTTTKGVEVGDIFDRDIFERKAPLLDIDRFGEKGEFHTIAKVWKVPRDVAMGLCNSTVSSF